MARHIDGAAMAMLAAGDQALPWDLTFPDVFWSDSAAAMPVGSMRS